jgi:glycosyltransferase involved in cell wall biosynthesis
MSTSPRTPRVVFGMPAFNRPDALTRTLESLLSQTCEDLAIVIVDDGSSAETRAIVESYAALDPRIIYEPNRVRLGMVANWRLAFHRGRALYPRSEYFAWVSDHDVWHPRWLETLAAVLDAEPRAVLAYPHCLRMYPHDRRLIHGTFDTAGVAAAGLRLKGTIVELAAGNAIYGLFRAAALAQAGVFRPVLLPDRQVLAQLSLLGEFRQVPDVLWYREASGPFGHARQRQMFFPGRAPLHTWLPPAVQHAALLLWDFGIRGLGHPACDRLSGARQAAALLWYSGTRARMRRAAASRGRAAVESSS